MTLQDAFWAHLDDLNWLRAHTNMDIRDWDMNGTVTHFTDGINDLYLGDDQETVFVVLGQGKPHLLCDAWLWQWYYAEHGEEASYGT